MKTRPVVVAVAVVLSVAACSGDDDPTPTSSSASTAAPTTTAPATTELATTLPSTTAPPSSTSPTTPITDVPTTVVTTNAPPSTLEGEPDWRAIVESLGQARQEIYAAPDVSRIPEVCGGATPCAEQLEVQIADLASKGWRVEGASPYTVLSARLEDFDGETLDASQVVTVVVVVERPTSGGQIVDDAGETVATVEPETPEGTNTENRTVLGRSGPTGDEWRIVSQERIGEVPG